MKKLIFIMREIWSLIKGHKIYILAPVMLALAIISFLVYYVGPSVIVTFIYAGV